MLTDKQYQAVALMSLNTLSNKQISEQLGVKERTLYNWKKNEEFTSELQRRTSIKKQENFAMMDNQMEGFADMALQNIAYIAKHGKTEKIQLEASEFIWEAIKGKAVAKVADVTEPKDNKEESIDLDAIVESLDDVIEIPEEKVVQIEVTETNTEE